MNRGIPAGNKAEDVAARGLCDLLNADFIEWPSNLLERADRCEKLLRTAVAKGWVHNNQISAITKLMWFLRPDNWTVFDRFAAAGLGLATSPERLKQFYLALSDLDFTRLVAAMQEVVDRTTLRGLPATRIVDSLLMARGGRGSDDEAINGFEDFLEVLPPEVRKTVQGVAAELQEKFRHEPLLKPQLRRTD